MPALLAAANAPAWGLPQGPQVVSGSASFSQSGNQLDVTEQSSRLIIDWSNFNLNTGESVVFLKGGSGAGSVVNEVGPGGGASSILGGITAPGLFVLSNPSGVFFGPSAQVNVGSLVVTTARMSQQDRASYVQSGQLGFSVPGNPTASVVNQGSLTVAQNGIAALVAPGVANSGVITGELSRVALASGNTFFIDLYGDRLVSFAVPGSQVTQAPADQNGAPMSATVVNSGKIVADGGKVQLTANVARGVVSSTINMTGVVQAQSIAQQGGEIVLDGGNGIVTVASNGPGTGLVDATGPAAGQQGGKVAINGAGLVHTGTIDVSGANGGGTIVLNTGDVLQSGILRADGGSGAGGAITVNFTGSYFGTESAVLSAEGGTQGGSIAVVGASGSNLLSSATHSVRSASGQGGSVTLDGGTINLLAAGIDASGAAGGGTIAVGGGPHSGTLPAASTTFISASSTLTADATASGDGGHIVIWSANDTEVAGTLTARGGAQSGNGGLIEVSTAGGPAGFAGTIDTTAAQGSAGTLLLDPLNITISNSGGVPQLNLLNSGAPVVQVLTNGNVMALDLNGAFGGSTGQASLFDGKTGGLISTLVGVGGASVNDTFVGALTNGNFVLVGVNPIFVNGTTGVSGIAGSAQAPFIATNLGLDYINALKTSGNPFLIGFANGITPGLAAANDPADTTFAFGIPPAGGVFGLLNFAALPNGNFVLTDPLNTIFGSGSTGATQAFNVGSFHATSVALIDLAPAAVQAQLAAFNLAHGLTARGDNLTPLSVTTLANGNVVVTSGIGDTFMGANFNPSNTAAQTLLGGGTVTALVNGNYVVDSPGALSGVGAITFGNGETGIAGAITAGNSLIGAHAGDLGGASVTALQNGNYVVAAPNFGGNLGAVTLGNGMTGTIGTIGASNSLVGNAGDQIGSGGILASATNGNFVVLSPNFAGGKGAVTLVTGTLPNAITASDSLVGSAAGDGLGSGGGAALTNGNFVVASPNFGGGEGAATFLSGAGGTVGAITAANSLIGNAGDHIGSGGVLALSTGNYLVMSPSWNGGMGAVTFANGTVGLTGIGAVSAANSLVGIGASAVIGTADNATPLLAGGIGPSVGINPLPPAPHAGVIELANGNYVVVSETGGIGAVTFGSGTTGVTGSVTAANSLIGAGVADGGITLLPNGNYLISSPFVTVNGVPLAGAVTFGGGSTGVTGAITAQNSLVGSNPGDLVGFDLVSIPLVVNGAQSNKGPELWQLAIAEGELPGGSPTPADLAAAGIGIGTPVNGAITVLSNGDYVVASPFALGGSLGAATFGSATTGVAGTITAQNSILGTGTGGQFASYVQDDPALGTFVVSGLFGNAPVVESAGSAKGITSLLGNANNFPGQSITISATALNNALAGGNSVVLAATNDIVILSPINAGGGKLALTAGNQIIFDASESGDIRLALTARTISGIAPFSQLNTTLDGFPFQDPLIAQMGTMVENITAPGINAVPASYMVTGPRCIVVRPDGSCQTEETGATLSDTIVGRGNAYLGDLLYRR